MFITLLAIIIIIIIIIIFKEYKNEKKYKQERKKRENSQEISHSYYKSEYNSPKNKRNLISKKNFQSKDISNNSKSKIDYPKFTHIRLIDMGFSNREARKFVADLIIQIETQIPLISTAINESNYHLTERLTHHIKGSATNIGTGGVADLLIEYNTYLKNGKDISIIKSYLKTLIYYTNELKIQYN